MAIEKRPNPAVIEDDIGPIDMAMAVVAAVEGVCCGRWYGANRDRLAECGAIASEGGRGWLREQEEKPVLVALVGTSGTVRGGTPA